MSHRKYWMDIVTHVIGVPLATIGTVQLYQHSLSADLCVQIGCLLYGCMFALMYLASTVYHAMAITPYEKFWDKIDRCAIFCTIAATITSIGLVLPGIRYDVSYLGIALPYLVMSTVWIVALIGCILELRFGEDWHKYLYVLYVVQALLGFIQVEPLGLLTVPHLFVLAGLVSFGFGAIYFFRLGKKYDLYHAWWHISVLIGSLMIYIALWLSL